MLASPTLETLILSELRADSAHDDVTASLLGDEGRRPSRAQVVSRAFGVFSGEAIVESFTRATRGRVQALARFQDGGPLEPGSAPVMVEGTTADILSTERTLLNLLSLACGVATETRKYVDAVAGLSVRILATRKTLPGLREVQLSAVRAGGGRVHRRSLSDGILIKENHAARMPETELLARAHRLRSPLHRIEIEVQNLSALERVLSAERLPDVIMLDNLGEEEIRRAVALIAGRCEIEVSGGITLQSVRKLAELGIDSVSVGRLTHSAPAFDLGLDFIG